MSSIVVGFPRPRDFCCICQDNFSWVDLRCTHEGANHDAFHEKCLIQWLEHSRNCPFGDGVFDEDAASKFVRPVSCREILYHAGSSVAISVAAAVAGAVAAKIGNGRVEVVSASSVFITGVISTVGGIVGTVEGDGILEGVVTLIGAAVATEGLNRGLLLMGEIGVGAVVGTTVAKILGVLDDQRSKWGAMGGVLVGGVYATVALSFPAISHSLISVAAVSGVAGILFSLLNKVQTR